MRKFLRGPRAFVLVLVTGLFLLFQNMTPSEFGLQRSLKPLLPNELVRDREARGLLSMYYADSVKRSAENSKFLSFLILEEIEKSLAPQLRPRALEITQALISDAREWDFDPLLILAIIKTESQFDAVKKGPHGERGLLQILPETAERISSLYHFKLKKIGDGSLDDPKMNLQIGIRYLDSIRAKSSAASTDLQKDHAVVIMQNYIALSQQMAKTQTKLDRTEASTH